MNYQHSYWQTLSTWVCWLWERYLLVFDRFTTWHLLLYGIMTMNHFRNQDQAKDESKRVFQNALKTTSASKSIYSSSPAWDIFDAILVHSLNASVEDNDSCQNFLSLWRDVAIWVPAVTAIWWIIETWEAKSDVRNEFFIRKHTWFKLEYNFNSSAEYLGNAGKFMNVCCTLNNLELAVGLGICTEAHQSCKKTHVVFKTQSEN